MESFQKLLKIIRPASYDSHLVIVYTNSHKTLTKTKTK